MFNDATLLRLFISQAFAVSFILMLLPLKTPRRRSLSIVIIGALVITLINGLLITFIGISFYIRFYLLTLTLPYVFLGLYFSMFKGAKFIFVILTIQVFGNVAILNGLLASYIFYKENNPLVDTGARVLTYLTFLPIILKYIRPTFLKMTEVIKKGWWMLNAALIISYALAYFILFVPDAIFNRPLYFVHAYIGMILSLLIYAMIFYLFKEIKLKTTVEHDKQLLSTQVTTLTEASAEITSIAYKDSLTGVKNRYSLFKEIDQHIESTHPFIIVFIDLDNLKQINDKYDHSVGDAYLKQFAKALKHTVKNHGEVYRFAGDEFVCIITEKNVFNPTEFKQSIAKEMVLDIPYYGLSLGLAHFPKDGVSSEELIKLADQAMYVEKRVKQKNR